MIYSAYIWNKPTYLQSISAIFPSVWILLSYQILFCCRSMVFPSFSSFSNKDNDIERNKCIKIFPHVTDFTNVINMQLVLSCKTAIITLHGYWCSCKNDKLLSDFFDHKTQCINEDLDTYQSDYRDLNVTLMVISTINRMLEAWQIDFALAFYDYNLYIKASLISFPLDNGNRVIPNNSSF